MDEFDIYGVEIDSDCVTADFDDYDLFGTRIIEDDEIDDDIVFE